MVHVIDLVSWKLFLVFTGSACKIYSINFTFAGGNVPCPSSSDASNYLYIFNAKTSLALIKCI